MAPLVDGTARLTTASLAAGSYSIAALYGGDDRFDLAFSPSTRVVVGPPAPAGGGGPSLGGTAGAGGGETPGGSGAPSGGAPSGGGAVGSSGNPAGGPGNAAVAPRDSTPPRVLGTTVTVAKKSRKVLGIVIRFDERLDPAAASDLTHYALRPAGKKARATRLAGATYDAQSNTVTIRPAGKIDLRKPQALTIQGLTDLAGNLLDGDGDGSAGGAYATPVSSRGRNVTLAASLGGDRRR